MIFVAVHVAELIVVWSNMSNKESGRGSCWNCENIMQCFSSREQMKVEDMLKLSDTLGESQPRPDTVNIEEAESSLRETGGLNYEVDFPFILLYFLCSEIFATFRVLTLFIVQLILHIVANGREQILASGILFESSNRIISYY